MTSLSSDPTFIQLRDYVAHTRLNLNELFHADSLRFDKLSHTLKLGHVTALFDFSKNLVDEEILRLLLQLAQSRRVEETRSQMLSGQATNFTEDRAVLHVALRDRHNKGNYAVRGTPVFPQISRVLKQMEDFSSRVISGEWRGFGGKRVTDVVNIGIGGSDLGPCMVSEALRAFQIGPHVHFVSNIDGFHMVSTLSRLDPETTLFIVASKTFTTQETLTNALTARKWLVGHFGDEAAVGSHFVALSTNADKVREFGISTDNMFEFWEWVGGRYSVWSAIGLSVACHVGMDVFYQFLDGAHSADSHFATCPLDSNVPVLMGLLGVLNSSVHLFPTHAVLPYKQCLHRFPAYLQQASMESNGKSVERSGQSVDYPTGAIVWGEPGTNGQHSFYQLLHQGTHVVPADFIAFAGCDPIYDDSQHHSILLCNFIAQTEGLMVGRTRADVGEVPESVLPHKVFGGNRPSTSIVFSEYSAFSLGALIALYEHKIFVEGVIWGINSFDQWGVELGKVLARNLEGELASPNRVSTGHDSSTLGIINFVKDNRN